MKFMLIAVLVGAVITVVAASKPAVEEKRRMTNPIVAVDKVTAVIGTESGNDFVRGVTLLLGHAGRDVDYATVMGDIGQAFIIQAAAYAPDLTGGYADVGWWPLDRWQTDSRLSFVASAHGCALNAKTVPFDTVKADPSGSYDHHFAAMVHSRVDAEIPVLAAWASCFLVTAHDAGEPPLWGWCLAGKQKTPKENRIEHFPASVWTYGEKTTARNRSEVDVDALAYAVELGKGQSSPDERWVTGSPAWASWEKLLVEKGADTQARWHGNMKSVLLVNRRAAIRYIEAMIPRHGTAVSVHLNSAVAVYREQILLVESMNTSDGAIGSATGRAALARVIGQSANLDAKAIEALEMAVRIMRK
jgi:hypothetical protein